MDAASCLVDSLSFPSNNFVIYFVFISLELGASTNDRGHAGRTS